MYSSLEALRLRLGHNVAQPAVARCTSRPASPAVLLYVYICWASNAVGMHELRVCDCFLPTRYETEVLGALPRTSPVACGVAVVLVLNSSE